MAASGYKKMEGVIVKLGYKSGKWQQRKFELLGPNLVYYNGLGMVKNGEISLSGARVECVGTEDLIDPLATTIAQLHGTPVRVKNAIKLTANYKAGRDNRRVYYLGCLNEEDSKALFEALSTDVGLASGSGGSIAGPGANLGQLALAMGPAQTQAPSPTQSPAAPSNASLTPAGLSSEQQRAQVMSAISNAGPASVEKTTSKDQERVNEVYQMLSPGVAGFLVTNIIPGGLGESVGLRAHVDLVLKLNGVKVGTGGEAELATLIAAKKKAFAETGRLNLTILDTVEKTTREVALRSPAGLTGEAAANAPLGIGFSYVGRAASNVAWHVIGWRKTGAGFASSDQRYPLYIENPPSDHMDVYAEGWRSVASGRMVSMTKVGYVPLYDYRGLPGLFVKVWKPMGNGWESSNEYLPLPIREG